MVISMVLDCCNVHVLRADSRQCDVAICNEALGVIQQVMLGKA